ncbi:hypothetical protein P153DRAFT_291847 [Dothidotthia symphoricarpi CBS 119687]|uniref:Subtilisin-like serine protease n=1 Tax=Dothidotthia symphoricarpi CBS 119687 TaxID=1392245 RepID=A0A6A6AAC9_9PLEO|nr:uncharacterized protein P153DRAFT_291847 [Dothidotthia symphoricarpi CBS 119687]KAF2128749.1 hypothetical protein P153DRAFT_291847 [Dothidotthia symphoricarpi CBS 119687]
MARVQYQFLRSLFATGSNSPVYPNTTPLNRSWLPGYPHIALNDSLALSNFLIGELECSDLDEMTSFLWMMTSQSSANIPALHWQHVKGRDIVLTEDPKLHLIWSYDKIYIKPVPTYLLSRSFWESYILDRSTQFSTHQTHEKIRTSALGFLRSYAYLIRHESDLRIAKDPNLTLVPPSLTWNKWCLLRAALLQIQDNEVSGRYGFGEIRLTRLNSWTKLLCRPTYHRTHPQYGEYFARFYAPLLFFFGVVSVMLSSMQLVAAVEQIEEQWNFLLGLYRTFSVVVFLVTSLLACVFVLVLLVKIIKEWKFAVSVRHAQRGRRYPKNAVDSSIV